MAQVLIRNVDQEVIDRLKTKAELHGHSLEQELRQVLIRAAPLSAEEKLATAVRIRAMAPLVPADASFPTAEALIRADRDRR